MVAYKHKYGFSSQNGWYGEYDDIFCIFFANDPDYRRYLEHSNFTVAMTIKAHYKLMKIHSGDAGEAVRRVVRVLSY